MSLGNLFSLLATLLVPVVYILYFRQVVRGLSVPNPATWLVWSTVMLLNALTYFLVSDKDPFKTSITVVTLVLMVAVMTYSWLKGKFSPLKKTEKYILFLCGLIFIFWQTTGQIELAHLFLQIILFISFVPTIAGIIVGKNKESSPPWIIAIISYLLLIISTIIDFKGNYYQFAYPIINGVLGNGSVLFIIYFKKMTNRPSK